MSLARAIETGDVAELPSRRDEDWRWSDLRGLIRTVPPASPRGDPKALGAGPLDGAVLVATVLNGRRVIGALPVTFEANGAQTISLRFVSQATGTAHHAAEAITLAPGATVTLLETHEGVGSGYVASAELKIDVGEGARLERIVLVDEAAVAISMIEADVSLAAGATYAQTIVTAGAKRQRTETRVRHPGKDASVRLDGLYLPSGARQADLTSEVLHEGAGGTTEQLTKGVVRDQARAIFQGRIVVQPGADQTDARMGHHALILSDRAEVDAKPELLIYADDVSCAHGNTVGALDEEALFYAAQRGIPDAEARAMLTEGFLHEVADRIGDAAVRETIKDWIGRKLRGEA
jgi:Fe-S cluster assembly protein SufD